MDGVSQQCGSLKENGNNKYTYAQNQKEIDEIPWTNNEEREMGKLNPDKAQGEQERYGKAASLTILSKWMVEQGAGALAKVEKLLKFRVTRFW